jgi:hypothetical protein
MNKQTNKQLTNYDTSMHVPINHPCMQKNCKNDNKLQICKNCIKREEKKNEAKYMLMTYMGALRILENIWLCS